MSRNRLLIALVLVALVTLPALASANPAALSRTPGGTPTYVKGDLGNLSLGKSSAELGEVAETRMRDILWSHFGAVGDEEMTVARVSTGAAGQTHIRFRQSYNGLPVVGAEMYMHVAADGKILSVNGEFVPGVDLPFSPTISADKAFAGLDKHGSRTDEPQLTYVRTEDGKAHLAWQATFDYLDEFGNPQRDKVFADAATGREVARHPQFHYARSLRTYNCNNGTSCGSLVSSSSNPINTGDNAIDSAHNYAIATYDYYDVNFGRDSIDDAGMILRSRVHYSNNYNNAFWDGTQMTYGDGDGTTFVPLSQDADVVGHELTHGVTENESGLIYSNQSGALNESLSDIFGAMVDRQEGATGNDIWLIGEDIYTPGTPGDALRNMAYPSSVGDYDYYPTRYTGSQDNGGVHWNSGISNLAFKLLVTGGTHPAGVTSNNVPGIGFTKAAAIFYEANTSCLTPSSNFEAARNCTADKAASLYGATEEAAVHEAWDAVGVPGGPGGGGGGGGGSCSGTNVWTGTASSSSSNLVTPNCSASGSFSGELVCDAGAADLDLYLEKQSCSGWFGCSFSTVGSSLSSGCDESVNTSGSSGTYRWRVHHYSGPAESFTLCTNKC